MSRPKGKLAKENPDLLMLVKESLRQNGGLEEAFP